jgi:hypothetical protein
MEQFKNIPPADEPRVIGLSGMLLFKQIKNVDLVPNELDRLENVFKATIATVSSEGEYKNVLKYSTNPNEQVFFYPVENSTPTAEKIRKKVETLLIFVKNYRLPKHSDINAKTLRRDRPSPIKEIDKLFKAFLHQIDDLGLYPGSIAMLGVIVQLELDKRNSDSQAVRHLIRYCLTEAESINHILNEFMKVSQKYRIYIVINFLTKLFPQGFDYDEKFQNFTSTKVKALVQNLDRFSCGKSTSDIKCLIFVQRRFSAKVLYHLLKLHYNNKDNDVIRPDFMVGNNAEMPESIESILEAKINRKVLEKFKRGETNVIVSTNVLEEGIDLQMCNFVVKFDSPKTFASYVQSKGRARMKNSTYLIMVTKKNFKFTGMSPEPYDNFMFNMSQYVWILH